MLRFKLCLWSGAMSCLTPCLFQHQLYCILVQRKWQECRAVWSFLGDLPMHNRWLRGLEMDKDEINSLLSSSILQPSLSCSLHWHVLSEFPMCVTTPPLPSISCMFSQPTLLPPDASSPCVTSSCTVSLHLPLIPLFLQYRYLLHH